jgi:uncharacterized membrane protein YcaP (DUF421 family)
LHQHLFRFYVMKKEEIQPWDWQRILFGQAPPEFLIEVFIRSIVMYLLLMIVLKFLGKRMDGQLTLTELAVMITLGAIVSVPMQLPDRGLLLGLAALLCVVAFQRGWNWITVKNRKAEETTLGKHSTIVRDGILQLDEMLKTGLSKQHVFATLREKTIYNLGAVKRMYFEACGLMSIYTSPERKAGLPVLPSDEIELVRTYTNTDDNRNACMNCGNVVEKNQSNQACKVCGQKKWMEAIV